VREFGNQFGRLAINSLLLIPRTDIWNCYF